MVNFVIAFREGLEAALIVGIVLGFLKRSGQTRFNRYVWMGIAAAIGVSALAAALLTALGAELEGAAEQIFEGATMLLAAVVVTSMVFWMRRRSRNMKRDLEASLDAAAERQSGWSLFGVAFLTVVREGIETALLLTAAAFASGGAQALIGALLGLALATCLGWLIYTSTVRLNLRVFFTITGVLLLFFAAGLLGRAIHEFQEASVLPSFNGAIYDTSWLLSEDSVVGSVGKTLFGYISSPSIESMLVYLGYLAVAMMALFAIPRRPAAR